jgi:hypothetical protein
MRTLSVLTFLAISTCACASAHAVDIISTFASSLEGWSGDNVSWFSNSGNPGGFARFDDAPMPPGSFIDAPFKFLGNWSSYKNVGALSYDHRIFAAGSPTGFADYQINIFGPDDSAFMFFPPADGVTPWVRHVAPIKESAWVVVGDWDRLLSNVTKMEIRIEHVENTTGFDIEGIDNVKLFVVPPASADFDGDNDVDGDDFLIWQRNFGTGTFFNQGDANNSGTVDDADLAIWEAQYAGGGPPIIALPEPSFGAMLLSLAALLAARGRRLET